MSENPFSVYEYRPPTREALVQSMESTGIYIAVCKFCKTKVRASTQTELMLHKCDETRIHTSK